MVGLDFKNINALVLQRKTDAEIERHIARVYKPDAQSANGTKPQPDEQNLRRAPT